MEDFFYILEKEIPIFKSYWKKATKIHVIGKIIHPKYYKHLKKGAHQSHLGRQKMDWFLAD